LAARASAVTVAIRANRSAFVAAARRLAALAFHQDIEAAQVGTLASCLAIDYAEPDWNHLPLLARRWALSAYDAAYLQRALARNAALIMLDARLAAAWDSASGVV